VIFILGAQGFVGSAVVAFMEAQGIPFVGITRRNYQDVVGKSCDYFINAAGNSSKRLADTDPLADFDLNVRDVLKSLTDFHIGTYLHISSIDVYQDVSDPSRNSEEARIVPEALSRYGFHKWMGETVVKRYADRFVTIRLGGMFGNNSRKGPAHDILNGLPIWVSPASRFLFLNAATVAESIWKLRDKVGETFNLTATDNLSLEEFAAIVGRPIEDVRGNDVLTYRVNVDKINRHFPLPTSRESVLASLVEIIPGKRDDP
jgi:nucleoside-diphosphate-sugar epimerase